MAEIILSLPELPPSDVPKEVYPALQDLYSAVRKLQTALNYDIGLVGENAQYWPQLTPPNGVTEIRSRVYCRCKETINYGQAVNLFNDGGELKARLAVATDSAKFVSAFCHAPGSYAAGAYSEFWLAPSLIESVGGLTIGDRYWLSVVPGVLTPIAPSGAGVYAQYIGQALATTKLWFTGLPG